MGHATNDRLSNLHLLPPQSENPWAVGPMQTPEEEVQRRQGTSVSLSLPLFWYEPSWIRLPTQVASHLATEVANQDVVVAALLRDVAGDGEFCELFGHADEAAGPMEATSNLMPRMTPYRAERYGLSAEDFDGTRVIDFRLTTVRDPSGRFAYSPEQIERWERSGADTSISGGGYVAATGLHPDIVSFEQVGVKITQLRRLAPSSAIFVSVGGYRLESDIAIALRAEPDGLIVRLAEPDLEGIQLAALVHRARKLMLQQGAEELPLWIVPGEVSPRDVAKLIALGATAVAIDSWCDPLIETLRERQPVSRFDRAPLAEIPGIVSEGLWDPIDKVIGLISSISPSHEVGQRLGTYHPRWAKACGAALLTP